MKKVDVRKVNPEDLVNIRDICVNEELRKDRQAKEFLNLIKNPYCYKYGDYIVKIVFEDTTVTLTERLREIILNIANAK